MDRGTPGTSVPTSVAQLSAAAAASDPTASAATAGEGTTSHPTHAMANTPPLASTWRQSRRPPFATTSPVRADLAADPMRLSPDVETK